MTTINQLNPATNPLPTDQFPGQPAGASTLATVGYTPLQIMTAAIPNMPTSDPHVAGTLFLNGGVICVSSG